MMQQHPHHLQQTPRHGLHANTDELQRRLAASLASKSTPPAPRAPMTPVSPPVVYSDSTDEYITSEDIARYMNETEYHECMNPPAPSTPAAAAKPVETPKKAEPVTPTVDFLSNFTSNKVGGPSMTFQSPEQMDRENKKLENEVTDKETEEAAFHKLSPEYHNNRPLPDIVEVATGEEEERIVFLERCKLFRWDSTQWKDRGIGEMKLLVHGDKGKCRLVMRREQVLKVRHKRVFIFFKLEMLRQIGFIVSYCFA